MYRWLASPVLQRPVFSRVLAHVCCTIRAHSRDATSGLVELPESDRGFTKIHALPFWGTISDMLGLTDGIFFCWSSPLASSWKIMSQPNRPSMWIWPAVCHCGNGCHGQYVNPKGRLMSVCTSETGAWKVDNASVAKRCLFKVFPVAQGHIWNHSVFQSDKWVCLH